MAIAGRPHCRRWRSRPRRLLNAPATADLAPVARDRFIAPARRGLARPARRTDRRLRPHRARKSSWRDHARLRAAVRRARPASRWRPVLPPDVIGLFVLMPGEA